MNKPTNNFYNDVKEILAQARNRAFSAVNTAMVEAYWLVGKRIVEEEQKGEERAAYGEKILQSIGGDFNVGGANNLANFSGLDQLELIGGNFSFGNNTSLTSMTGLGNLTNIGGYFYVSTGHNLTDLTGLNNLAIIGGSLGPPGGLANLGGWKGFPRSEERSGFSLNIAWSILKALKM